MKRLFKNTRSNLTVTLLALVFGLAEAQAVSPIATVNDIKGNAFIHHHGKTKKVKSGDAIYNTSEIFTEVGSQVSFSDYYDHQYHLSGSGQVKIKGKTLELKSGYLLTQSFNRQDAFYIETANASVQYLSGEAVVSFDSYNGKSQIMVVKGQFNFSNIIEKHRMVELQEGQFSFISKNYENGTPRAPTSIGQSSFKKIVGLFKGIKTLDQRDSDGFELISSKRSPVVRSRSVASVGTSRSLIQEIANGGDKDKVESKPYRYKKPTFKKNSSEKDSFLRYYQSRLNQMKPKKKVREKTDFTKKTTAKLNVFGATWVKEPTVSSRGIRIYDLERAKKAEGKSEAASKLNNEDTEMGIVFRKSQNTVSNRAPASVSSGQVEPPKDVFETSLRKEFKKQTRHTNEVNSLIKELQSYDQDYQKSY